MKEVTQTYLKKVLKDKKKWSVNESFIKKTKENDENLHGIYIKLKMSIIRACVPSKIILVILQFS
ncbi:unnamed protein product [marine sediment metagenome]|uniref:Uncharacterized protein n=1 Tax=marine sediment metagenome TaxID=412755 RepID=X1IME3_9ZZZZ